MRQLFFAFCSIWTLAGYFTMSSLRRPTFWPSPQKVGKKGDLGVAPLRTPLVRNGGCGCLISVCVAYRKISVPKFPLTQHGTPPPACLQRVTSCGASSAPARAPATLVRWRIGHLHMQLVNIVGAGLASARTFAELITLTGRRKACPYIFLCILYVGCAFAPT